MPEAIGAPPVQIVGPGDSFNFYRQGVQQIVRFAVDPQHDAISRRRSQPDVAGFALSVILRE